MLTFFFSPFDTDTERATEISTGGEGSAFVLAKLGDGAASSTWTSWVFSVGKGRECGCGCELGLGLGFGFGFVLGDTGEVFLDGDTSLSSGESTGDDAGESVLAYSAFCLPPCAIDNSEI